MPETIRLEGKGQRLSTIVKRVASASRFVVVTGAGISVSCGIPDFRSSDGIFRQIQDAHGGLVASGRDLFDASVIFRTSETAGIFYRWMTHLRHQCSDAQPGAAHRFIRQLADRGLLQRSYTQNIDGLERKAGLAVWDPYAAKDTAKYVPWRDAQSVPLHGSMDRLVCQLCASSFAFSEKPGAQATSAGDACPDCTARSDARAAHGRRMLPAGKLRPTVVLYEEPHPHCEDIAKIIAHDARALAARRDARATNVVLVFGTTLKVPGCRQLVRRLATASPANTVTVLVNNEPVCGKSWDGVVDYQVVGSVEDWCARIEKQWNAQTKITRWTRTRKRADAREGKENKESASTTGHKRKACSDVQDDVYVDVVSIDSVGPEKYLLASAAAEPRVAKKPRPTRTFDSAVLPARRSLRIAEKRSLEDYESLASQAPLSSISICT
ncbi:NAD-dependent deacetylase hst3 [Coemansia sp. RSA 1722]|nr:NAD-dependent deacetylase hst3 [Coemansia sp. RSA 485]KAJ2587085.1 NAD-dependent deacetylase hst3 [Coemansia sp. RSA 1722]